MIDEGTIAKIAEVAGNAAGKLAEGRTVTVPNDIGDEVLFGLEQGPDGEECFRELTPAAAPAASPISAHTLGAVTDYLRENRDGLELKSVVVHVAAPDRVEVLGPLRYRRDREVFLRATPALGDRLADFEGKYQNQEDFILKVQTLFADTPERATLLKLAGNMTDEAVRTAVDDGVTQQVVTKSGGAKVGTESIKNPYMLVPLRSFPEVGLSPVPFVLRVKGNGAGQASHLALFDAGGGAWRVDAIEKIREVLAVEGRVWGVVA